MLNILLAVTYNSYRENMKVREYILKDILLKQNDMLIFSGSNLHGN